MTPPTGLLTSPPSLNPLKAQGPCFELKPSRVAARFRGTDCEDIAIVGSGNCAHALACYLGAQGHRIHLLVRNPAALEHIASEGKMYASGVLEGVFPIEQVTADPLLAIRKCRTIFIATVTNAYPEIARRLAPHLGRGHRVVLFSSKFGGSQDFARALNRPEVRVIETDALLASRVQTDGSIWIRGLKRWNLYSSPQCSQTVENAEILLKFFPELQPAQNLVQRGLTDFGALAHPLTMIANMNQVDKAVPFLFYCEGFTERTIVLLESLEKEFGRVAEAYNTSLLPAKDLLNNYYGCKTDSLLEAMRSVPNYRTSMAPTTLQHRYLSEDVACTLLPAQQLGALAGLKTPVIDSVITLASLVYGEDLSQSGRTLERLGWSGKSYRELLAWLHQ